MAIARRNMLQAILAVALGAPVVAARRCARIRGVVEAHRGARYPGPIAPLDTEAIRRPGRWLG